MTAGRHSTAWALLLFAACAAHGQERVEDVRQGTNTAVAISPDGQTLITDLLGGLWRLPTTGGGALSVLPPGQGARLPRFSPDGTAVVFQRFTAGQWDLWLLDVATGESRALTTTAYDEQQPDFGANGRRIVFAANRTGRYALWSMELSTGALEQLNDEPGDSFFPAVSDDGRIVYTNRQGSRWTLRVLERGTVGAMLLDGSAELSAPTWRPGGGVVVFQERDGTRSSRLRMLLLADEPVVKTLTSDEDVFEARPAWLSSGEYLYTADGQIWRRGIASFSREPVHMFAAVTLDAALPEPMERAVDASGPWVAAGLSGLSRSGDDEPAVFSALGDIWIAGRRGIERLTDDAFFDVDPSVAPDHGIVFASDRGGKLELWRIDPDTATLSPLTSSPVSAFAPSVAPDGRFVAYLETAGLGPWAEMRLRLLDLVGNSETSRLGGPLYDAGRPRWATAEREPRILVEARPGDASAPRRTLSFDIGGNAIPADEPREDASTELPALAEDARPQWRRARRADEYVIQAGRVFDGVRNTYLRHMDIHVEGREIAAIVGRGLRASNAPVIDAREATVMPGLIDTHAHNSLLAGERLGRAWLAYGVTTVGDAGGHPGDTLPLAEAWASGAQPGPRLLISNAGGDLETEASALLLPATHRIAGLAHELAWQSAQLGFPTLPRGDLLAALSPEPAHGMEPLRVSPLLRSYQDTLGATLGSRRFLSTTLAAATGAAIRPDRAYALLFDAAERRAWQTGEADRDALNALGSTLARLLRSGANLAIGSDAPVVPYGLGLHTELALLVEAGIPSDQVLRLATAQSARALGLDARLGTIEPGKIADLVIVDGDPLARIADTLRIRAVVREGQWLDRAELLAPTATGSATP